MWVFKIQHIKLSKQPNSENMLLENIQKLEYFELLIRAGWINRAHSLRKTKKSFNGKSLWLWNYYLSSAHIQYMWTTYFMGRYCLNSRIKRIMPANLEFQVVLHANHRYWTIMDISTLFPMKLDFKIIFS